MKGNQTEENIEELFVPFLRRLAVLHARAGRRLIAFVAAPPAVGKSTLVAAEETWTMLADGSFEKEMG